MHSYEHGGNPYALEKSKGISLESVIDFSANINPLGPSEKGLSAIKTVLERCRGSLTRYPDPDYTQLRKQLADYHNAGLDAAQIYPTNGGIEAIHDVFRALKPKKTLIVAPAFVEYEKAAAAHGGETVFFPLEAERGFAIEPGAFYEAIDRHRPDLVVLGSPNNPTGKLVAKTVLMHALERLSAWNGALLTDEAFMEFLTDETVWSMAGEVTKFENLFVTRSLTKFFAVPGLRAGYLMTASPAFAAYWQAVKPVWGFNALAEAYVVAALEDAAYIENTRTELCRLKTKLIAHLANFKDLALYAGEVNYVLIQVNGPFRSSLKQALEASGILIRDCANYKGLEKGFYRLAVLGDADQARLMEVLSSLLSQAK
ncbi:pyridoxal phosphate-dependent aminotransferase [Acidaminobacter hydrogenoformans]|uniref:Aminotransferase n=1 Tax=Acidaminobacter hydrogenoformans DSM 2784 TaxID=1120920 RepID=A0A1G5S7S9_9FIRM|nr:threonine-phosphate decarboxylase [Acidaminobacter hydrogenoformans]SCZ81950.1 L-threonine O-3-phosphate decarboxylase [Acidaminobacter hydrogenoformans DSM 2784]